MSNLDLATLHLAVRYEKHVNDLVDEIYKVHKNICELCEREKLTEKDLELGYYKTFASISKKFSNKCDFFVKEGSLRKASEKTSFEKKLKNLKIEKENLQVLDFLSFRILDFAHVFGNERKQQNFGNWAHRSFQLFFRQKGQIWIIKTMLDLIPQINNNDPESVKKFIRKKIDKDFLPYPEEYKKYLAEEYRKVKANADMQYKQKPLKLDDGKKYTRTMGFEIEHLIKVGKNEHDLKLLNEEEKLALAGQVYKNSNMPEIKDVKVALHVDAPDVIKYGSLTRDPSNARMKGYVACEYSSPIRTLNTLKENAKQVLNTIKDNDGAVREDCGIHVHVSIEDLKPSPSDTKEVKEQKLEALKRIFKNFIILQDKIDSVLPVHRRDDNSPFSGQSFTSFVKNDKKFMIGLINSCNSYDEMKEVLMVGGKYLALAPFNNTIEFRSFPATLNVEVVQNWFELVNNFVHNSINGKEPEECLNIENIRRIKELTNNTKEVDGMQKKDKQDICFKCNSMVYSDFTPIRSPVISRKKMTAISREKVYGNVANYVERVNKCLTKTKYLVVPNLHECKFYKDVLEKKSFRELLERERMLKNNNQAVLGR